MMMDVILTALAVVVIIGMWAAIPIFAAIVGTGLAGIVLYAIVSNTE